MNPQNDAIFEAGDTCSKKTVIFGIYVKFREDTESEKEICTTAWKIFN